MLFLTFTSRLLILQSATQAHQTVSQPASKESAGARRRQSVRQDTEVRTVPATQSDSVCITPLRWSSSPWFNERNPSSLLNKQAEPVKKTSTSPFLHLSLKSLGLTRMRQTQWPPSISLIFQLQSLLLFCIFS